MCPLHPFAAPIFFLKTQIPHSFELQSKTLHCNQNVGLLRFVLFYYPPQSEGNSKLQPLKLPCFPFSLNHHYFYTDFYVLQESIVHGFFKANDQV